MHYALRFAPAVLIVTVGVLIGACTDALSSPRLSPIPTTIRTPELSQFGFAPRANSSPDCGLGVSDDPACNEPCNSAYGCGGSGTPPGENSGGDLSNTHVANQRTTVGFPHGGTDIHAHASADFSGNYFKQTVTARAYRNAHEISKNSRTDESNETHAYFVSFRHETSVILPTGVKCDLTAGASGQHRAETRVLGTTLALGFMEKGSDAAPANQSPCQTGDEDSPGGGGGDTLMITCIFRLRYENGVLVSETLVACV